MPTGQTTPDIDFVSFIVASITGDPYCFELGRSLDEKGVLISLRIDQPQMGRVIGKRGATAQSIRTLLRALGAMHEATYSLKIDKREQ